MNVLMFGWEFPPHINGGLGIACYEIVKALLKKNIEIQLVLPKVKSNSLLDSTSYEQPSKLLDIGLKIHSVDSILQPYMNRQEYNQIVAKVTEKTTYGHDLIEEINRYAEQAILLIEAMNPDILYAHDWLTIQAGISAKKITNKPLFFHVHSLEIDRSHHPDQRIFDIEYEGLHFADKIFAVSHYTRDRIIKYYQVSADKIEVIYNGIPGSFFMSPLKENKKKDKLVLFLGRITYQKGPFYFVDAAYKILSMRQDIQFVIAGDGDLLHDVIQYVAQLKISSHVQFLGFLDRHRVHTMFELCQVYVMPSVSEPFGLTCLEALILNVPVVISKQSGAAEVLDEVCKVDYWDTEAMAEEIMMLIDNPRMAADVIKKSQSDLIALTWTRAANGIIHAFNEYLGA